VTRRSPANDQLFKFGLPGDLLARFRRQADRLKDEGAIVSMTWLLREMVAAVTEEFEAQERAALPQPEAQGTWA